MKGEKEREGIHGAWGGSSDGIQPSALLWCCNTKPCTTSCLSRRRLRCCSQLLVCAGDRAQARVWDLAPPDSPLVSGGSQRRELGTWVGAGQNGLSPGGLSLFGDCQVVGLWCSLQSNHPLQRHGKGISPMPPHHRCFGVLPLATLVLLEAGTTPRSLSAAPPCPFSQVEPGEVSTVLDSDLEVPVSSGPSGDFEIREEEETTRPELGNEVVAVVTPPSAPGPGRNAEPGLIDNTIESGSSAAQLPQKNILERKEVLIGESRGGGLVGGWTDPRRGLGLQQGAGEVLSLG